MSKEFTLSSAATATTNVTSSTPCQDAKLTVWAIDPMYCTIAGYSYSDGMAM